MAKKKDTVYSNAKQAYDYLTSRGIAPVQSLAMIGNMYGESGFQSDIQNSIGAYGLHQWLGSRKKKLFEVYGTNPTFQNQLDFLVDEHLGNYPGYGWNFSNRGKYVEKSGYRQYGRGEFNSANNIDDAVVAWNQGFGRPGAHELRNDVRIKFAKDFASKYNINIGDNSPTYSNGEVSGKTYKPDNNMGTYAKDLSDYNVNTNIERVENYGDLGRIYDNQVTSTPAIENEDNLIAAEVERLAMQEAINYAANRQKETNFLKDFILNFGVKPIDDERIK